MKKLLLITCSILICASNYAQNIYTIAGGTGDGGAATNIPLGSSRSSAIDAAGNIYFADYSDQRIRKVTASIGIITTVAGIAGTQGFSGDSGLATSAKLNNPAGLAIDASGDIYIADYGNNRIRKITVSTGIITTVAGGGNAGYGGPATSAYLNNPSGVAIDSSGNIYIAEYSGSVIRKVTSSTGIISTVAGTGAWMYSGDGGAATSAALYNPSGVVLDRSGNIYIADYGNNRIRKVTVSTGIITTVAGCATGFYGGDGGAATSANLYNPMGLALDTSGNIYIADYANGRIRKVTASTGIITTLAGGGHGVDGSAADSAYLGSPAGVAIDGSGNIFIANYGYPGKIRKVTASTGIISTVAGGGTTGDGGIATGAYLYTSQGITLDRLGNIYIAELSNQRIRKISASTGIITTVAGCGIGRSTGIGDSVAATSAYLYDPTGVAVDSSGNIYIADNGNSRIRKVTVSSGIITTIAGTDLIGFGGDGGTSSMLYYPAGVAVDDKGNIYIADHGNHRIRKITASTGIINTVAGSASYGYGGDGGSATSAKLLSPTGVAIDTSGNIYIADNGNNRIRKVTASTGIISTVAGNGIQGYSGDSGAATSAKISRPQGVAVDILGNIYIADGNYIIRKVTASTGIITSFAVGGTGVSVDGSGNIYIADYYNNRIREVKYIIDSNLITTNQSICSGSTPSTLTGSYPSGAFGSYKYSWQKSTLSSTNGFTDAGENDSSQNYSPSAITTDTWFRRVVSSGLASDTSNAITIKIKRTGFTIDNAGQCFSTNNFILNDTTTFASGTITHQWNFGESLIDTSTSINPSKTYSSTGAFTIQLISSSTNGCIDTISKTVSVNTKPNAGFTINDSSQCLISNSFSFADTSTANSAILTRVWNFGTGINDTSTFINPTKVYSLSATDTVKLIVSNNGCKDSLTKTVSVNPKPTIGFTINDTIQCLNGNSFSFSDTTTISRGTFIRQWNFGTGITDTSTATNPNKVYTSANKYSVKLLVTSDNGCSDSLTENVIVYPKPNIGFTINNASQCIIGNNFSFTDTSKIDSGTLVRKWNLGNGISDTSKISNPIKTYSIANSYSIKLFETSNKGCLDSLVKTISVNPKPKAGYTINNSTQCINGNNFIFTDTSTISGGSTTSYWNFGEGITDTSFSINPNKVYSSVNTYSVKIVSVSDNGCIDSLTKTVTVFPKPTVGFTQNVIAQCLSGNNFVFNDTSNISSGTLNRIWSFGDTTTSTSASINKSYSSAGTYQIKLVETSNNNCADSISKKVTIYNQPKSGFTISDTSQCLIGNSFSFNDTTSTTNIRLWSLGDLTKNANDTFTKSYSNAGTYQVKLKVTDSHNCSDSSTKLITVKASPAMPSITALSKSLLQSSVANSYQWYLNNSIISSATNQTLAITTNGNYSVKIDTTNGCTNTSNLFAASAVGVNEIYANNEIKIYPNPATNSITLSTSANTAITKIKLVDIVGKNYLLNYKKENENFIIDVSELPTGIYFLQATTSNGTLYKKVLIER